MQATFRARWGGDYRTENGIDWTGPEGPLLNILRMLTMDDYHDTEEGSGYSPDPFRDYIEWVRDNLFPGELISAEYAPTAPAEDEDGRPIIY